MVRLPLTFLTHQRCTTALSTSTCETEAAQCGDQKTQIRLPTAAAREDRGLIGGHSIALHDPAAVHSAPDCFLTRSENRHLSIGVHTWDLIRVSMDPVFLSQSAVNTALKSRTTGCGRCPSSFGHCKSLIYFRVYKPMRMHAHAYSRKFKLLAKKCPGARVDCPPLF
jgi:hypothetical protein